MTTSELKQQIEKVLGNSIRCLLPSYWWKRLFHQVADRIDEVEQKMDNLPEGVPIVSSVSELDSLNLNKGRVASVVDEMGFSQCYWPTDEDMTTGVEEVFPKLTRVKSIEIKNNPLEDAEAATAILISQREYELFDDLLIACIKQQNGITSIFAQGKINGQTIETALTSATIESFNKMLAESDVRFAGSIDGVGERTTASLATLDKKFTINIDADVYVKGTTWEKLAKESDLGNSGEEESSSNSLFFYAPTDANTEISDVEKQHNAESYLKIAEGFETDKYYDVKVLMSTSQLVTFDAIQILNPAIYDGKLKLLFRWDNGGKERMVIVTSDGSATIEDVGTSASGADFTFVAAFDTSLNDTTTTSEKSANKTNASLYYQNVKNGIKPKVALKFSFRDSSSEVPVEVVPSFIGMVSMYNGKYQSSYGANAMVFAKLDIGDRFAGLTFDLIMDPDIGSVLVPHIDASEINILHARVVDNAITSDGLSSLLLKQNQELYKYALSAPVAVYVSNTRQLISAKISQGSGFLAVYAGDYVFEFYEDGTIVDHPIQKDEVATVEYVNEEVAKKVDKVEGKQLSTEDFTTALKTKLEGLSNYDDTELSEAVARLRDDFDSLTQEDISAAIENFNEIISFLDGIEDSESLDSIIASIEQQIANKQDKLVSGTNIKTINGESILGEGNIVVNVDTSNLATKQELNAKQDVISDLETIRSGAALGATALQEHQDISHLATKEEVTNLQNEVIANEEVSAAAFNEINERIEQLSENVSGAAATKEELAEAVVTLNGSIATKADADSTSASIASLEESVSGINASLANYATKESLANEVETITNTIIENEEITATALTNLDARIKEIIARLDALEG